MQVAAQAGGGASLSQKNVSKNRDSLQQDQSELGNGIRHRERATGHVMDAQCKAQVARAGGSGGARACGFGAKNGSLVLSAVALAVGAGRTGATKQVVITRARAGGGSAWCSGSSFRGRQGGSTHLREGCAGRELAKGAVACRIGLVSCSQEEGGKQQSKAVCRQWGKGGGGVAAAGGLAAARPHACLPAEGPLTHAGRREAALEGACIMQVAQQGQSAAGRAARTLRRWLMFAACTQRSCSGSARCSKHAPPRAGAPEGPWAATMAVEALRW